jgi:hypothetical protein
MFGDSQLYQGHAMKLFLHTTLRYIGAVEVQLQSFLASALDGNGQLHAPVALVLGKTPETHWIWGWVAFRASLDILHKRKISCPWHDCILGHYTNCGWNVMKFSDLSKSAQKWTGLLILHPKLDIRCSLKRSWKDDGLELAAYIERSEFCLEAAEASRVLVTCILHALLLRGKQYCSPESPLQRAWERNNRPAA